eukprot:287586-Prymnesium_polylepis.1
MAGDCAALFRRAAVNVSGVWRVPLCGRWRRLQKAGKARYLIVQEPRGLATLCSLLGSMHMPM